MRKLAVPPGTRFGRLTVVSDAETTLRPSGQPTRRINCVCDCGAQVTIALMNLRSGATKSCGCLRNERVSASNSTHGKAQTRLYSVWCGIKQRAVSGIATNAKYYKGRGIGMYEPWADDFATFDAWVRENLGECPEGNSLDRIDNDAGYFPGNLRWATRIEQANNRSNNRIISYGGEQHSIAEWERRLGWPKERLRHRIRAGWGVEKALTTELEGR